MPIYSACSGLVLYFRFMIQRSLLIIGLVNLCAVTCLLVVFYGNRNSVVYVDSSKLLNNYNGMETARMEFQQKTKAWRANIDSLAKEIQNEITRFQKGKSGMTEREKELTQRLIQAKQRQYKEYELATTTQAKQESDKMTSEVVARVNAYLKKYGESKGYHIILAATEFGNVAYAQDGLDITDDVLEGLNAEYVGK